MNTRVRTRIIQAIIGLSLFIVSTWPAFAVGSLVTYPPVSSLAQSSVYSLVVNGQAVPVQRYNSNSFARFSFSGSANITIIVREPVTTYVLSPKSYLIRSTVTGRNIAFTLNQPRKLILRNVNALTEKLFLLADAMEGSAPRLGGPGVTNVLDFGADNTGTATAGYAIQQAIDSVGAQSSGGILFFPPGTYRLEKSIYMRSNVHVYLTGGAVLQVPPAGAYNGNEIIGFYDTTNAKLTGRGIIYGSGSLTTAPNIYFHGIVSEASAGILVQDVIILDPRITGMRICDTHDSQFLNVTVMADNPLGLSDGLDIDSSQRIVADGLFIYSSDDPTSLKGGTGVRGTVKNDEDLTIKNAVFYNSRTGSAFKIGTEDSQAYIRNITYSNVDVVNAQQLAAFYPVQGANIDTIYLTNVRSETIVDRLFEFHIVVPVWEPSWNGRLGYIHNVSLKNIMAGLAGGRPSEFRAYDSTSNITGISFQNFSIGGNLATDLNSARLVLNPFVSAVTFSTTPMISSIFALGVTDASATITWNTNVQADSQVEFGKTASYGLMTPLNPTMKTSHAVTLSALTPGCVYHYRAYSRDASGNLTITGDGTFTTPSAAR